MLIHNVVEVSVMIPHKFMQREYPSHTHSTILEWISDQLADCWDFFWFCIWLDCRGVWSLVTSLVSSKANKRFFWKVYVEIRHPRQPYRNMYHASVPTYINRSTRYAHHSLLSLTFVFETGEPVSNHDELMCNFFAQPDALAYGKVSTLLLSDFQ